MLKKLTPQQVRHYRDNGYLSPVEGLGPAKAAEYRRHMEDAEKTFGPMRKDGPGSRSHLLFKWASELVREAPILDAVEDLIGPNILVYSVTIWLKEANDPSFVSWHQDSTYHYLESESVGAWVALSDASVAAGCMEVVPGSHRMGQLPHEEIVNKNNLLPKGQTVTQLNGAERTSFMSLALGQFSLHDSYLLHRSGANTTAGRRIGIAMNYIPTHCRCLSTVKPMASLVRGRDNFGHYELEPVPQADCDEQGRTAHAAAIRRYAEMKASMRSY